MNEFQVFDPEDRAKIREVEKITIGEGECLVVKLGVDGMVDHQIQDYCNQVAVSLNELLPGAKIMLTTVTHENPIDFLVVSEENISATVAAENARLEAEDNNEYSS